VKGLELGAQVDALGLRGVMSRKTSSWKRQAFSLETPHI
jgi:hypothetical protein